MARRALVGLDESWVAGQDIAALFLLHFISGALEPREEIENLGRLRGPFLFPHPLIQVDLLFALDRLENLAGLVEPRRI